MKQGLFILFQETDSNLSVSVMYDREYCKILMGSKVTPNEFLRLEQNFLADLVAQEPGNEHLK